MAQGKHAQACPKLAESYKLDSAGGTVLLLALCYEQVGKTASAWVRFNDAVGLARKDGRKDREARARERIAVLEPMLSRLTLVVPASMQAIEGLVVRIDGTPVPSIAWGRALPTDPGPHQVSAAAPGMRAWSTSVDLAPNADRVDLPVPVLDPITRDEPVRAAPVSVPVVQPADRPAAGPESSAVETAGFVLGGLGIVSLGVGGYYGYVALDRNADARERCPTNACTDAGGVALNEESRRAAIRADIFAGAGIVLAGVGAYLWLSSSDGDEGANAALVVRPAIHGSGATLGAVGRF